MKEIKLYSAQGSNCSERVEWLLNFKGLLYERVEVDDLQPGSHFRSINPFGYVPAISLDGYLIAESMAIAECVEELYPLPVLFGDNWQQRALTREICEYVNSTIHAPQNRSVLSALRPELADTAKRVLRGEWISAKLEILKPKLWKESNFAVGNRFSLADIFVATIYKKAIQHGAAPIAGYKSHLEWLRTDEAIARADKFINQCLTGLAIIY
ncbi:glutathione S-transferase family protein [Vibrio sp. SCSIO 43137]|uniref:glutathione S-transferase family protein n=1 Tax=Vibrio sp. SCSIO 43137 TaxID=3021011 RepID=UPI002307FB32|nr:glutathione S-transferase family protein [Vibrio sp. SCSIO 43137]WCE32413.1 glutathione S-transferase family protein [Vibrio sp. SCSIO 43137]